MKIFKKRQENQDDQLDKFVDTKELEQKIQNYLTATNISREELEKPILEVLLINDLDIALKYLKNCDLTKYSSLQLEMILKHLDELQVLALEKCKKNKKKVFPMTLSVISLADFCSLILVFGCNLSLNYWFSLIASVDALMLPWTIFEFRNCYNIQYNKLIENLNDIAKEIYLIMEVKSQKLVPEKEDELEKGESLQDRVTRLEQEISDLGREDLTRFFFNSLSEYVKCSNLEAEVTSGICLELCGLPYYEYVLNNNLAKLEVEINRVKNLNNLVIDMKKMFDDYLSNIGNFTDKKEAFLELLNLSQNYKFIEEYDVSMINCFWETIQLINLMDRVTIIQALEPQIKANIEAWIKGKIAGYDYNIQVLEQEIQEETDPTVSLILLISKLESLEKAKKAENKQTRNRTNKEFKVQAC